MHILIPVLHRPEKPTGVCRHAVNLAQCMVERDEVEKVTLVIGSWQKEYFSKSFNFDSDKIHLVDVPIKNGSISRNIWYLLGLPRLAKQLQPDVIHLSFPLPFVRSWFSAPVVATIHDLYPLEYPDNFGYPQVWFNQWFLRRCIAGSDGLSCVSETTQKVLEHYFPQVSWDKSVKVIYNSVDFRDIDAVKPSQLLDDPIHAYLLCIAQHRKNKNLDLLIKAYARLVHQHKISEETRLILVGSHGPETNALGKLIQSLNLQDHVVLLSGLEDRELRWLYEYASLFVIPSSTEGFCLPLIEAQSLACPALCSDIPIFREVAGPNCSYFSLEGSPLENLAAAIEKALASPKPAHSMTNPKFLRETIIQDYWNFYASVGAF